MIKLIIYSINVGAVVFAQTALADSIGKSLFENKCAVCHGAEGVGIEGIAPPLRNPDLWKSLGENGAKYFSGVMAGGLAGSINVAGIDYRGLAMPAQSDIDSAELVLIAKYVVQTLNDSPAVPDLALINQLKAEPLSQSQLRKMRRGEE
jgi:mono/diheme cytochrome c family protein